MGKTAVYTKKAVDAYRARFDFVQIRLDKGEKEKIESIISPRKINDYIIGLINDDLSRRTRAAAGAGTEQEDDGLPFS